ncbi:MAG: hypothetical protein GX039_01665 [Clostridia bacterium]|nr:hypothetical protein [Clostridia bacterium]
MKIRITTNERLMLIIGVAAVVIAISLGYPAFVAGLLIASIISLALQRWQATAVAGLDNIPPRKAFNIYFGRSLIRSLLALALLALARYGGIEFLLGTLLGLVLQVLAYMAEAIIMIIVRKEG